jgi:lipoprotein-anchoring transpeptidase ErfK/SrfK
MVASRQGQLGGGLIEFLVNGGQAPAPARTAPAVAAVPSIAPPSIAPPMIAPPVMSARQQPDRSAPRTPQIAEPERSLDPRGMDPRFLPQMVDYSGPHGPGTIVINTRERYLYLVEGHGQARRYGIGVGRPGFEWAGVKSITRKAEWPDWRPPPEMLKRRPDLPRYMAGGPENPMGARGLYLGSSLYRIHGTNEPHTIGQAVSSGCIRMRNEDITDLYERVRIGTKVIVI